MGKGLLELVQLMNRLKGKISFTYFRIMGDTFINLSNKDIKIGQDGFMALIELFAKGHMAFTTEFRFYNFAPEPTPFLAFIDACLVNNPTLKTIGFARNRLNDDMCAAILQRVYFNPALDCVDLNGNPLTISTFKKDIVSKYFTTRENFNIIYD